jgi:hypothetical protein
MTRQDLHDHQLRVIADLHNLENIMKRYQLYRQDGSLIASDLSERDVIEYFDAEDLEDAQFYAANQGIDINWLV